MNVEKRLIDANDPLKQLSDYMEKLHCSDDYRDGLYRGMEIAESYIKNAPTVDAVEVVHGRWVAVPSSDMMTGKAYKCSECNKMRYGSFMPNYCQNCGAKMDGGNEDG